MNAEHELISKLGGTGAVAKLCGVTSQAVSQWKKKGIPRPWKIVLFDRAKAISESSAASKETS